MGDVSKGHVVPCEGFHVVQLKDGRRGGEHHGNPYHKERHERQPHGGRRENRDLLKHDELHNLVDCGVYHAPYGEDHGRSYHGEHHAYPQGDRDHERPYRDGHHVPFGEDRAYSCHGEHHVFPQDGEPREHSYLGEYHTFPLGDEFRNGPYRDERHVFPSHDEHHVLPSRDRCHDLPCGGERHEHRLDGGVHAQDDGTDGHNVMGDDVTYVNHHSGDHHHNGDRRDDHHADLHHSYLPRPYLLQRLLSLQ